MRKHADRCARARDYGRHQPGIAQRAEVLARKERKATERAEAAHLMPIVGRPNGLRGILDDRNARRDRRIDDRVQVGRLTKQVDWHDGAGT